MTCLEHAQLERYYDGQLSASQITAVEAHLQTCEDCRAELQAMHRISDAVSQAKPAEPGEGMMRRWARSIQTQRDRQIRHLAEWAMAAAAGIVLGIFGLWPNMDTAQAEPLLLGNVERAMLVNPAEEQLPANLVTARLFATDLASDAAAGSNLP